MTRIVRVELQDTDNPALREAADIMRAGGLVVFPTETVYGLGTIASNQQAVLSVFTAKQRPSDTPLPVQIADISMLPLVTLNPPDNAYILARTFWPGPLTIVLPRNPSISDAVTAGNDTIGVRIPDHTIMLQILKELNAPAVATSANISGCPPPTTAREAADQIGNSVDLIIDSGPCQIGASSTVITITNTELKILRQGTITLDQLTKALNPSAATSQFPLGEGARGIDSLHNS